MKKFARSIPLITILLNVVFLNGCATMSGSNTDTSTPGSGTASSTANDKTTAAPVAPVLRSDQIALQDGINLFNNGDYNGAIKRLSTASEIWAGGVEQAIQLEALKYTAFSYCVTSRQTLCKAQFEKALKLNPAFDLAPGEKGHPLWGPIFDRVKKVK